MIIKKIALGSSEEAYIENRILPGFNIIYSDDNNKGKTIVMQSALYAIGNEPIFPATFKYKEYYHYIEIELDNKTEIIVCRKGDSFIVKTDDGLTILDSVSELKRLLNRKGIKFPEIIKDNTVKMVDPVLLYQIFFVGQDNKDSTTIFSDYYYKKDDFWSLIYSIKGIDVTLREDIDQDIVKSKIISLTEEKKVLLSKNKILKKATPSLEIISQTQGNNAFDQKIKKIDKIRECIIDTRKKRNRALQRKTINENALKEIRAISRTPDSGDLYCMDCGSNRIAYSSGDKSYTFDISDVDMRRNILESIQDKIDAYEEEMEDCTKQINELQRNLQELLNEEEIDLESLLIYKTEIAEVGDADTRIAEIDKEIKTLKNRIKTRKQKDQQNQIQKEELKEKIIGAMNQFYLAIDPTGSLVFDDLFSKRSSVYSGCEETEFYLAKLYSLAKVLEHDYPVMMDYFRDGELSSEKEDVVIEKFGELDNQIIFTATLKKEELGKYESYKGINAIDYSVNEDSHILAAKYVDGLRELLSPMMINI